MKGTNPTKDASYCTSTRCLSTRLRVFVTDEVTKPRLPSAAQHSSPGSSQSNATTLHLAHNSVSAL